MSIEQDIATVEAIGNLSREYAEAAQRLAARCRELEAERKAGTKFDDAVEVIVGPMCYTTQRLLEHFDDDGYLLGEGKWRQKAIYGYCKQFDGSAERLMTLILRNDPQSPYYVPPTEAKAEADHE